MCAWEIFQRDSPKNLSDFERVCDLKFKKPQCRKIKTKKHGLFQTAHLWESEEEGELTVKSEKEHERQEEAVMSWSWLAPARESRLCLFPAPCSVIPCWWLECGHGRSLYTTEVAEGPDQGSPSPFPSLQDTLQ